MKFAPLTIHRRELKNAPYNPRRIGEKQREKLRQNIKRVGLVNAIIWNRTTGNVVGGHQRVSVLDSLMRTDDYLLHVDAVDMDEATEREQNVFLNNPDAQGEWDQDMLAALVKSDGFDPERSGIDLSEAVEVFGEGVLVNKSEKMDLLAEQLRKADEAYEKVKNIRANKDQATFYRVVVFASPAEAEWLGELVGDKVAVMLNGKSVKEAYQRARTEAEADPVENP